jgi:ArsR family transcriptional regulator, virulence genes transcriptional regulator
VLTLSDDIADLQASVLRALAAPNRLRIVHLLGSGPREVNEIAQALGLSQAAASQHLAAMRSVGLVDAVRDGRTARYQLTDIQVLNACDLMRDVLVRRLALLGDLAAASRQPIDANRTRTDQGASPSTPR